MLQSESLDGVPLLLLANKQDLSVSLHKHSTSVSCYSLLCDLFNLFYNRTLHVLQDCMSVSDIRTEFKEKAHHLGHRDCTVMAVSALTGYDFSAIVSL